ncbi:MAG: methyltransferase domain-containing protein [Nitrosomonadales bacterium]|nr:methyltransferase domain-containing protein [Nitrosomonadales bacterium]
MHAGSQRMTPLFAVRSRQAFVDGMAHHAAIGELAKLETSLAAGAADGRFSVAGHCIPCGKDVMFRVDMGAGGRSEGGVLLPNWRERLICPECRMSNRQRLVATLVKQHLQSCTRRQEVYLMERMTPLYKWVASRFDGHAITGSEYFGPGHCSGEIIGPMQHSSPLRTGALLRSAKHKLSMFYSMMRMGGVRHEDVTALSFADASIDLIVSNDVFEHIPTPTLAYRECARVLRAGGVMIATIPFHSDQDASVVRAELNKDGIVHRLPASYHGNPVSADGSLVFTDFGWDIIRSLAVAGFSDAVVEVYGSAEYGHLGGGQLVFRATK